MSTQRRDFLRRGTMAAAAILSEPFYSLRKRCELGADDVRSVGYGPLRPVRDGSTGLELLKLPDGFRYFTFGWTSDPMEGGALTPGFHDGMAALKQEANRIILLRNHEVNYPSPSIAPTHATYDSQAGGGCTRLEFDASTGKLLIANAVLGGTHKNCAGGPTPWGTWLSCEETVDDAFGQTKGGVLPFEQDHGYIFEVPSEGLSEALPLRAMGRFVHEAVAVDPETGFVFETEDQETAGFYRFLPTVKGRLAEGGKLQMMKVVGYTDLRQGITPHKIFDTVWVDIEDPLRHHSPSGADGPGVFYQGKTQGATTFARLEGCWQGNGRIYFVSTSGGDAKLGQIWEYHPKAEQLRLLFESPASHILDYPDNITVSPRGGLVLCEDGERRIERLCGLSMDGELFHFAENNVVLHGEKNGFQGDYRHQEWCGCTFSPDGLWLFANIQTPGFTVAITGPWGVGLI